MLLNKYNFKIILSFLLLCSISYAQLKTDFKVRYTENLNGDITIIANNMISRSATENYNGNRGNDDFINNVYVDIDNDESTFNSSSANFTKPDASIQCLTVKKAYLYWAAANKELSNGDDNQPDWDFNTVKLMVPNTASYINITADDIIFNGRASHFSNDPYICVSDITSKINNLTNPYGKYQIANVEAKEGNLFDHNTGGRVGTSAGWQIVFVYESIDLPSKNISIYDGYGHVTRNENNFEINFNGFQTPIDGNIEAKIAIGALEGDRDLSGDRLEIKNTAGNFEEIATETRRGNNFFNSKISVNNNDFIDRNPASLNTLGFDAAVFKLNNTNNSIIQNNQNSATIRLTSNQEVYGMFLLAMAIDAKAPNLHPINLTSNNSNNTYNVDDEIEFNFDLKNKGNDNAKNVSISTNLGTQLEFISASVPNGVTYNFDENSKLLTFNFDDTINTGSENLNISFITKVKSQCHFLNNSCNLNINLQLEAIYDGEQSNGNYSTLSIGDANACGISSPLQLALNPPQSLHWLTTTNALNKTVDCNDTDALLEAQSLQPTLNTCDLTLTKTEGQFVADTNDSNNGTYTNTWSYTDQCGRSVDDFIQIITIKDTNAPVFEELPSERTVSCLNNFEFTQAIATDTCANVILTFEDTTTEIDENQTYSITRHWTATDSNGNQSFANQKVTINPSILSALVNTVESKIDITCEAIPSPPQVSPINQNDELTITFNENTNIIDENTTTIIRTWLITDTCDNEYNLNQTVTLTNNDVINTPITKEICITDEILDLNDLIDSSQHGIWTDETNNEITNTVIDPNNTTTGDYVFNYTRFSNTSTCTESTTVNITINDNCLYKNSCIKSTADVSVSKLLTPNNDFMNEYLKVEYILNQDVDMDQTCDISIDLKIYNRNGTLVYSNSNYQNDWKGQSNTSSNLTGGTYFYVIELKNSGLKPIQGYFLLGNQSI